MTLKVRGIHHITAICRDMERTTEFYTDVLGMTLVKQTVNYDDPDTKHFYFGDERGRPGTILTFFEYSNAAAGIDSRRTWRNTASTLAARTTGRTFAPFTSATRTVTF